MTRPRPVVALAGMVSGVVPAVSLMAVAVFFMYLTASTYWAIILDTVEEARIGGVSGFAHLIANLASIAALAMTGYLVHDNLAWLYQEPGHEQPA